MTNGVVDGPRIGSPATAAIPRSGLGFALLPPGSWPRVRAAVLASTTVLCPMSGRIRACFCCPRRDASIRRMPVCGLPKSRLAESSVAPIAEQDGTCGAVLDEKVRLVGLLVVDSDHVEPTHAELSRAAALLADQHRRNPRTHSTRVPRGRQHPCTVRTCSAKARYDGVYASPSRRCHSCSLSKVTARASRRPARSCTATATTALADKTELLAAVPTPRA